jgi:hypothetical protein
VKSACRQGEKGTLTSYSKHWRYLLATAKTVRYAQYGGQSGARRPPALIGAASGAVNTGRQLGPQAEPGTPARRRCHDETDHS